MSMLRRGLLMCRFPRSALIFDLLNNPARTKFDATGRASGFARRQWLEYVGLSRRGGVWKWTGIEPPVDVMKHALAQSMKEE